MWLTSNSKYTTTIVLSACAVKKNKRMTRVKEECPEVHIRTCSCSLPNDRIESAKERKLAGYAGTSYSHDQREAIRHR